MPPSPCSGVLSVENSIHAECDKGKTPSNSEVGTRNGERLPPYQSSNRPGERF